MALYSYLSPDQMPKMTSVLKNVVKVLFGSKGKLHKLSLPVSDIYVELIMQIAAGKYVNWNYEN